MAVLLQRGRHVAEIELAGSHAARRRGLLGRDGIDGAFLLEPCRSVHTIGMRFAIDVAYCRGSKADGLHIMCIHTMPTRRVGRLHVRSRCVVEAEAGAFARWGLAVGDRMEIR